MLGLTNNSSSVQTLFSDFSFNRPSMGSLALGTPDFSFNPEVGTGGIGSYVNDRGGLGAIKYNTAEGLVYNPVTDTYEPKPKQNKGMKSMNAAVKSAVKIYGIIALLMAALIFFIYKIARRN